MKYLDIDDLRLLAKLVSKKEALKMIDNKLALIA